MIQILDLQGFFKISTLTEGQSRELSEMIITKFPYFKMTEILLFFFKLKSGDYGKIYGRIDPIMILNSLNDFKAYRVDQINYYEKIIEDEKRAKQLKEWEEKAVPCPEHLEIAKLYFNDNRTDIG